MTNIELADEIENAVIKRRKSGWGTQFYLDDAEWDQIIAALRQSSDMVLVPRTRYKELLGCLEAMATGKGGWAWFNEHRDMLTEAEGHHE